MSLSTTETRALADLQAALPGPLRRVDGPPDPGRLPEALSYRVEDGAITALALRHAELTGLPDSIGDLVHLRQLDLSGNRLAELPAALGRLIRLAHLYLDGNQLTELPESLDDLTRLEALHLDSNRADRAAGLDRRAGGAAPPVPA